MYYGLISSMNKGGNPLLLDAYPNSYMAYSMFKLRTAYAGSCLRVRRSSDNNEQDIGFVNNYLDTASLLTFVGANNGFVVKWYDQSGNVRDLSRATAVNQPQIVVSGSLITRNGITVMSATSTQSLQLATGPLFTTSYSWWLSLEKDTTGNQYMMGRDVTNALYADYGTAQYIANANPITTTAPSINTFRLVNGIYQFPNTNFTANLYFNGSSQGTATGTATIGSVRAGFQTLPFTSLRTAKITFNEFVVWTTDQMSNRAGIENNIKSRNLIY
jgi:hypothetical protein